MKNNWMWVIIVVIIIIAIIIGYSVLSSPNTAKPATNTNSNTGSGSSSTSSSSSSSSSTSSSSGGTSPETYDVAISNFAFSPSTLTINKGDTVVWTNDDSASHTVTSDSGSELSSPTLANTKTYSHTFTTSGTFNYHCSFHTSMKAKIIVE